MKNEKFLRKMQKNLFLDKNIKKILKIVKFLKKLYFLQKFWFFTTFLVFSKIFKNWKNSWKNRKKSVIFWPQKPPFFGPFFGIQRKIPQKSASSGSEKGNREKCIIFPGWGPWKTRFFSRFFRPEKIPFSEPLLFLQKKGGIFDPKKAAALRKEKNLCEKWRFSPPLFYPGGRDPPRDRNFFDKKSDFFHHYKIFSFYRNFVFLHEISWK